MSRYLITRRDTAVRHATASRLRMPLHPARHPTPPYPTPPLERGRHTLPLQLFSCTWTTVLPPLTCCSHGAGLCLSFVSRDRDAATGRALTKTLVARHCFAAPTWPFVTAGYRLGRRQITATSPLFSSDDCEFSRRNNGQKIRLFVVLISFKTF